MRMRQEKGNHPKRAVLSWLMLWAAGGQPHWGLVRNSVAPQDCLYEGEVARIFVHCLPSFILWRLSRGSLTFLLFQAITWLQENTLRCERGDEILAECWQPPWKWTSSTNPAISGEPRAWSRWQDTSTQSYPGPLVTVIKEELIVRKVLPALNNALLFPTWLLLK